MQEKFLSLKKGTRVCLIAIFWLLTILGFAGCVLIKEYASALWLEIILTCVGLFFSVVAICVTIYQLVAEEKK